jgi:hypothetical protein
LRFIMAEPTSALTFEDLILLVAREAGIAYYGASGNEPAMIPVDEHDLDLCVKIVNDAINMFISDAPPKGWRWMRRIMSVTLTATRITGTADSASATTIVDATLADDYDTDDDLNGYWCYILTGTGAGSYAQITDYDATVAPGTVTVADWLDEQGNPGGTDPGVGSTFAITPVETVGGDIARYPLEENFGGTVDGQIKYASDSAHSAQIEWCDESTIRALRAVAVQTGYPSLAAIRPIEPKSGGYGPTRRWELIVDPQPVAADILEFPYTLFFDKLRLVGGVSSGGGVTTLIDSTFAKYYPDDYFIGWKCYIFSGTAKNARAIVTDFTGNTFTITVANWLGIDDSADAGEDPTDSTNSAYYLVPRANLHPAGYRFDEAIKSACLAQAEMQIEDVSAGYAAKYQQKDLPNAWKIDIRSAPRKLYPKGNIIQERTWTDITTDHDV